MTPVNLRELERVEVTILVDNYTDLLLLQSTNVVKRALSPPPQAFLAEHGFSCLIKTIDGYIERNGIAAPPQTLPVLRYGFDSPVIRELNLRDANITSIIWTTGFSFDFSWVRPAILDSDGFPVQKRGVADQPGLYFVGLPWLPDQKTGLLLGVGEQAAHVAAHIAENRKASP